MEEETPAKLSRNGYFAELMPLVALGCWEMKSKECSCVTGGFASGGLGFAYCFALRGIW